MVGYCVLLWTNLSSEQFFDLGVWSVEVVRDDKPFEAAWVEGLVGVSFGADLRDVPAVSVEGWLGLGFGRFGQWRYGTTSAGYDAAEYIVGLGINKWKS